MEQEKGAVYCRLSQDDGSAGESGSIQTQRTLLTQYCKEHSIQIVDYYCDDGWSGTNFERPEFKRMIDDIESGKNQYRYRSCRGRRRPSQQKTRLFFQGRYGSPVFP